MAVVRAVTAAVDPAAVGGLELGVAGVTLRGSAGDDEGGIWAWIIVTIDTTLSQLPNRTETYVYEWTVGLDLTVQLQWNLEWNAMPR